MNNIIILGEVIEKSVIHFDYYDKLKAYFLVRVIEDSNVFEIVISEKHIDRKIINNLDGGIAIGSKVCIRGSMLRENDKYIIVCKELLLI